MELVSDRSALLLVELHQLRFSSGEMLLLDSTFPCSVRTRTCSILLGIELVSAESCFARDSGWGLMFFSLHWIRLPSFFTNPVQHVFCFSVVVWENSLLLQLERSTMVVYYSFDRLKLLLNFGVEIRVRLLCWFRIVVMWWIWWWKWMNQKTVMVFRSGVVIEIESEMNLYMGWWW